MRKVAFFLLFIGLIAFANAQEQYILTSDSVKLYINVKGEGPACLYLHGGPGSGSYWLEKTMGPFLEKNFQMIYLDQRGVGRSTSPKNGDYSMSRMVMDFEEVREHLGIEQWLTLGHSFGGLLQMGYVNQKTEVIKGMLCINCTFSMNESFGKSWLPKAMELAGDSTPDITLDTTKPVLERMHAIMPVLNQMDKMWKIFFAAPENTGKLYSTYGEFDEWNVDQTEKILPMEDYWADFRPLTKQVKQPVLVFYGKTDWAIGPGHYRGAGFPNVLLWSSEGGHMPFFEDKENLKKAILSYIETYGF